MEVISRVTLSKIKAHLHFRLNSFRNGFVDDMDNLYLVCDLNVDLPIQIRKEKHHVWTQNSVRKINEVL